MIDNERRPSVGGTRRLLSRAAQALALSWQAGPIAATTYLLVTIVLGLLPAGVALLTKGLLDSIQFSRTAAETAPLIVWIATLSITLAVLPYIGAYAQSRLSRGITLVVQDQLYGSVNAFQGISRFENPAFLDRLRLAQQSALGAPDAVAGSLFGGVQGGVTLVGFLGVLLVISPVMVAITVVAAIPAFFVQLSISRQQAAVVGTLSPRNRRQIFYQMLMLDLSAVKEIRLFGLGDFLAGRMRRETAQINAAEDRLDRDIALRQGPLAALSAGVAAGGLAWMVMATLRGQFTVGDVSAFVAAIAGVQGALGGIVSHATRGYQSLLLFGHYLEVTRMGSDLPAAGVPQALAPLRRAILIEDVWFRYSDEGPWVLSGVSLEIPFGNATALVGLNGAGKSTLVKLLCRFYDPVKGRITWDGVDLRQVDVAHLRDRISAVFQDYMSYDLTVAENIGVGDVRRMNDRSLVHAAARAASVDELVVKLPRGYDTILSRIFLPDDGEDEAGHGTTLSGGQWQRIALARAIMRSGRDLLILDEPTAGLDAEAEQAVHDTLREYRQGATSVLISHRLGAVRRADRIAVLRDGRITETGGHGELMAANGEYARLFRLQAAQYVGTDREASVNG